MTVYPTHWPTEDPERLEEIANDPTRTPYERATAKVLPRLWEGHQKAKEERMEAARKYVQEHPEAWPARKD